MTERQRESHFADGFDGKLSPGRAPAVLSIDLMRAYFDQNSPLCLPSAALLRPAAEIIAVARDVSVPVIHTRVSYGKDGHDGGVFIRKVPALRLLIGETPIGRIMPEVSPSPSEVVLVKQYASAFFGTDLESILRESGVDTVIIVGVSTSGCVRATAVDAIQLGFTPLVVSDAVADRNPEVHNASLYDLQAKYAEVRGSESVLDYLRSPRP